MLFPHLDANTARQFFSFHQQVLRLSLTILCVVFLLASLKIYQDKGNLTSTEVNTFNAISNSLALLLGLSFFDAFRDLAKVSIPIISTPNDWSNKHKELIQDITSLIAVAKLGFLSRTIKPWASSACFLWIASSLAAQTAVVLISQSYSMQDGTDWTGTYVRPDQVNATDLRCYYHHLYDAQQYVCDQAPETVQGIVHAYGESTYASLSYGQNCESYNVTGDILKSQNIPKYFCRRTPGHQEFAYRFLEYNPYDEQRIYPFLTDRVIAASAGPCFNYSVSSVQRGSSTGGKWSNYTYSNGTYSDSILLPVQIDFFDGTVYTYRGFQTPQNATIWACGDRCIWMWAHRTKLNSDQSTFYQCPVTVNPVQSYGSTLRQVHQVSNPTARLAASSIALQGGNSDPNNGWTQSQFYPYGNAWDIHNNKSIDEIGANMAEFALGSIAAMASDNPPIQIQGMLPRLGSRLYVSWDFAVGLLVNVGAVHCSLSAFAFLLDWRNRKPVSDGDEIEMGNNSNAESAHRSGSTESLIRQRV